MKIVKKDLAGIGALLLDMMVSYAHFMFTVVVISTLAALFAWAFDYNFEASCLIFALVWFFTEVKESRKECRKAVIKVEALKHVIIETYSTTRSTPVGDREFEAITVQGQVFREKIKEQGKDT